MRKLLFTISIFMLGTFLLNAQNADSSSPKRVKGQRSSSNSIFINILGPTIPASLNYEHIWTKNGIINIGTKIGGFYSKFPKQSELTIANGSFEVNLLVGRSKHLFEMGIGWAGHYGSYYSEKEMKTFSYGIPTSTFSMYYRFQKPTGGVFFHAGFTGTSILVLVSNDLSALAIGNGIIYGYRLLSGQKPSFSIISLGIGYSFKK